MLPEGWRTALLEQVAKRGSGHTPSKDFPDYWNGGVKWVSLADSNRLDKGLITATAKEISLAGVANSSAVVHPAGTVVLSRDAGVGKSAVIAEDMAVSQHFIAWDCSASYELNNWYLYHWLQQQKPEFERVAVGSTIKTIGLPYFKKLQITLPPLEEQVRIATILSAWDRSIEAAERLLFNARTKFDALIQRLLLAPAARNEWQMVAIAEISERVQRRAVEGAELPILMISAGSGFVRQDEKYSRFMAGKSVENYIALSRGEFAYNKGNSKLYQFGCVFPLRGYECGLVPNVYVCFALLPELNASFYEHLFRADYLRDQLGALVNTGVRNNGLLNIRPADFLHCKVPVPPKEVQDRVAKVLTAAARWVELHELDLDLLNQEKVALRSLLLSGKRRVKLSAAEAKAQA